MGTMFRIFSDDKALENIGKVGDPNARVQRWLEFPTAFDYTLEYPKGLLTETPISCPVCQSRPRNTAALDLAASSPSKMAVSSSSGPVGSAPVPLQLSVLV